MILIPIFIGDMGPWTTLDTAILVFVVSLCVIAMCVKFRKVENKEITLSEFREIIEPIIRKDRNEQETNI